MPNKATWNDLIDQAQKEWVKLSRDQLQSINGDRSLLANLLQEHYGVAQEQATQQVEDFYGRYQHRRNDAA